MSYSFTQNFNVNNNGSHTNIAHLVSNNGIPTNIIEIGTYEGSTAFWLSDQLTPFNKNLKIYTMDPHVGSADILYDDFVAIKQRFLQNLENNKHKNIEYICKPSKDGLLDLINQGIKAQLIYIDGDHTASGVISDLVLSWHCLALGGVILCDDTNTWKHRDKSNFPALQMSPRMAVESFIWCNYHKIECLCIPDSNQTAFRKIAE